MRSVLLICSKEELEKINYQLEYMGKPCIADNGMFPRYFTVKEERFVENHPAGRSSQGQKCYRRDPGVIL